MALELRYLPEFNNYGIEKAKTNTPSVPEITLNEKDSKQLGSVSAAKTTIGILLGQDKSADGNEYYTVEKDYLRAVLKSGAAIRFLDYDHAAEQLQACDGLILPGGCFDSPQAFYLEPTTDTPSKRSYAYAQSAMMAETEGKPILGICAGAQMLGGMHNMKMYRSIKEETASPTEHKNKNKAAHQVLIFQNSPLQKIMQTDALEITINSRHNESMTHQALQDYFSPSDMEVYAVSKKDALPEAWGNMQKNILCIQWHPENLSAENKSMQNIFNWLTEKAAARPIQKKQIKLPLDFIKNQHNFR